MSLSDAEIARIKYHLGYNVLTIGSEPYVGHVSLFDQVIQPYATGGARTTSSTAVAAANDPTSATLVLANATDFVAGDVVIVDVDSRQERATIQNLSGSNLTVLLSLAHSGTYPVAVEGPEALVRSVLQKTEQAWNELNTATLSAGVKQLDNGGIEWFPSRDGGLMSSLRGALNHWRNELASLLGIVRLNGGGGSTVSLY